MKVSQMSSNQFIVETKEGTIFQSYESNIAFKPSNPDKPIVLGRNWKFSNTTSKYRCQFLGESGKVTQAKLDKGTYILDNDL